MDDKCTSTYCGNDKCDGNENCGICLVDCKCQNEDYSCIDNQCTLMDKCLSNSECDDNNACTTDSCEGNPKDCIYVKKNGCDVVGKCVEYGTQHIIEI